MFRFSSTEPFRAFYTPARVNFGCGDQQCTPDETGSCWIIADSFQVSTAGAHYLHVFPEEGNPTSSVAVNATEIFSDPDAILNIGELRNYRFSEGDLASLPLATAVSNFSTVLLPAELRILVYGTNDNFAVWVTEDTPGSTTRQTTEFKRDQAVASAAISFTAPYSAVVHIVMFLNVFIPPRRLGQISSHVDLRIRSLLQTHDMGEHPRATSSRFHVQIRPGYPQRFIWSPTNRTLEPHGACRPTNADPF